MTWLNVCEIPECHFKYSNTKPLCLNMKRKRKTFPKFTLEAPA